MRVVRDRADARGLPSRRHFALTRLIALVRMQQRLPISQHGLILPMDRDQSAAENYGISIWIVLTVSCYVTYRLAQRLPLALAALLSIPAAAALIEVPIYVVGAVFIPLWNAVRKRRIENNIRLNSVVMMTLLIAAAAYFATVPSWVSIPAWLFLGIAAMNAIAAAILRLLRGRVLELERRCGL